MLWFVLCNTFLNLQDTVHWCLSDILMSCSLTCRQFPLRSLVLSEKNYLGRAVIIVKLTCAYACSEIHSIIHWNVIIIQTFITFQSDINNGHWRSSKLSLTLNIFPTGTSFTLLGVWITPSPGPYLSRPIVRCINYKLILCCFFFLECCTD